MIKNLEKVNLAVIADSENNVKIEKLGGKLSSVDSVSYVFTANPVRKKNALPKIFVGSCITMARDSKGGIRCYVKRFMPEDAVSFVDDLYVELQNALCKLSNMDGDDCYC